MHPWGCPILDRKISKCRDHVMEGKVARNEESKGYIGWTLVFIKYFGSYSKCAGKSLAHFEEWKNMIRFDFKRFTLAAVWYINHRALRKGED